MSSTGFRGYDGPKRDRTSLQYDRTTSKLLYYDAKFHGRTKVQQLRELVKADIKRHKIIVPSRQEPRSLNRGIRHVK
ncbi:MAG TPA: hypothetical protein VJ571_08170 [Candidatus Nitrosotalea sp.]|nr:hypothetical protein [Candidatus Nitrosotalea sp.]